MNWKIKSTLLMEITLLMNSYIKYFPDDAVILYQGEDGVIYQSNEKTVEEISAQNIIVTMNQIKELSTDKDLIVFFKNSRGERREIGKASSEKEAFKVIHQFHTHDFRSTDGNIGISGKITINLNGK